MTGRPTLRNVPKPAQIVGLIIVLVIFGNAKAWLDLVVLNTTAVGSTFGVGAGIALVLAILVGGILVHTDFGSLGLSGGDWQSSLRLGVWVGGTVALVSGLVIVGGGLVARRLGLQLTDVTPAASAPWGPLLWRAVLLLWVDTVLPEELGFRGALMLTLDGQEATPGACVCVLPAGVGAGRSCRGPASGPGLECRVRRLARGRCTSGRRAGRGYACWQAPGDRGRRDALRRFAGGGPQLARACRGALAVRHGGHARCASCCRVVRQLWLSGLNRCRTTATSN